MNQFQQEELFALALDLPFLADIAFAVGVAGYMVFGILLQIDADNLLVNFAGNHQEVAVGNYQEVAVGNHQEVAVGNHQEVAVGNHQEVAAGSQ